MRLQIYLVLLLAIALFTACDNQRSADTNSVNDKNNSEIAPSEDSAKDEAAIRKIVKSMPDALSARDYKAAAKPFAEDGDLILPERKLVKGRDEIEKFWEESWSGTPKDCKFKDVKIQPLRFIGKSAAVVDMLAEFENCNASRDRATYVFAKKDGKWEVASLRVMMAEKKSE